jgi:hypothetical protein
MLLDTSTIRALHLSIVETTRAVAHNHLLLHLIPELWLLTRQIGAQLHQNLELHLSLSEDI